jgi:hypothetical protein
MLSQIQHFHLNYAGMHIVKTPHTMNIMFNHQRSHHLRLWKIGQLKFCFEENQLTLMIIRKYPNVLFALVHHFGLLQPTWTHKDISCIRTSLVKNFMIFLWLNAWLNHAMMTFINIILLKENITCWLIIY